MPATVTRTFKVLRYDPANPPAANLIASTTTDQGTPTALAIRRSTSSDGASMPCSSTPSPRSTPWS